MIKLDKSSNQHSQMQLWMLGNMSHASELLECWINKWRNRDLEHYEPVKRSDTMRRKLANKGAFSVKSFYEKFLVRTEEAFHVKSIWIPKVQRKVCFFTWSTSREVILTVENLGKRKVVCISWCYSCKEAGEDVDHLLLHCISSVGLVCLGWCQS